MIYPMKFFDYDSFDELQLDIVGFLAILGEGSVLTYAQVASLSKWFLVPRLVPAPQAFMKPSRLKTLEPTAGYVTGVHSGNDRDFITHIGNIVCDAESLPEFSVRCVRIERNPNQPDVKARTKGPLTAVAILGAFLSALLLGLAVWRGDGAALLATILLSFLSTLIGFGNKWSLKLPARRNRQEVPDGDVVVRYPKGNFLVVQCDEDIAREIYFAPETVNYMISNPLTYRMISLVGTMMLMSGVICLGNSSVPLQMGFAASYMILNAAYWIVAALPAKLHWNTAGFRVVDQKFHNVEETGKHYASANQTFTQALWKALIATKSVGWVRRGEAAPETRAWDEWLVRAEAAANKAGYYEDKEGKKVWEIPEWDFQGEFKACMMKFKNMPLAGHTAEIESAIDVPEGYLTIRRRDTLPNPHKQRGVPLTNAELDPPEKKIEVV